MLVTTSVVFRLLPLEADKKSHFTKMNLKHVSTIVLVCCHPNLRIVALFTAGETTFNFCFLYSLERKMN